MKAVVVNALWRGFELDDVQIAAPMRREVLVDVIGCGVVTGAGAVLNTANVSAGDTAVMAAAANPSDLG
jgi:Zn-dependent alcohol dehydrogenase